MLVEKPFQSDEILLPCIESINDMDLPTAAPKFSVDVKSARVDVKSSRVLKAPKDRIEPLHYGTTKVLLTQRSKDEIEAATGQRWRPTSVDFPQYKRILKDFQCPHHPTEPVRFFCLQCEVPCFCGWCCADNMHNGHDVMILPDAWLNVRQLQLEKRVVRRLHELVEDTYQSEAFLRGKRQDTIMFMGKVKTQAEHALTDLVEQIQSSERNMLAELRNVVALCGDHIESHLRDIEDYGALLHDMEHQLNRMKSTRDAVSLCRLYSTMTSSIEPSPTLSAMYTSHFSMEYPQEFLRTAGWYRNQLEYLIETLHTKLAVLDQVTYILHNTPFNDCGKEFPQAPARLTIDWDTVLNTINTPLRFPTDQATQTATLNRHVDHWKRRCSEAKQSLLQLRLPVIRPSQSKVSKSYSDNAINK